MEPSLGGARPTPRRRLPNIDTVAPATGANARHAPTRPTRCPHITAGQAFECRCTERLVLASN
eukprot:8125238-Alexandrium_andersonii.AAC.1